MARPLTAPSAPGRVGPTDAARAAWIDGPFRIEYHLTCAEIDDLCQMPKLGAALMAVVGRFTASSRRQRVTSGQFPNLHWVDRVVFDRGEDRWGKFTFTDLNDETWWDLREASSVRDDRLALLDEVMRGIGRWKGLDAHIADVPFSTPARSDEIVGFRKAREGFYAEKARRYGNLLGLWWDIRINDGFTPDAARMILRLLLSTEAQRLIEFPDDTSPYIQGFPPMWI